MYHIECRRWFQRTYGNTYHSVYIWKGWNTSNPEQIAAIPRAYGYGEQCLQSALDWLRAHGHIPSGCSRCGESKEQHEATQPSHSYMAHYGTLYIREVLHSTYSIVDVPRQKDL